MTGLSFPLNSDDGASSAFRRVADAADRAAQATADLARATDELTRANNQRIYHSNDARCTCESCPIHGEPDAAA